MCIQFKYIILHSIFEKFIMLSQIVVINSLPRLLPSIGHSLEDLKEIWLLGLDSSMQIRVPEDYVVAVV